MNRIFACTTVLLVSCAISLGGCKPRPSASTIAQTPGTINPAMVDTSSESYRYAYHLVSLVITPEDLNMLAARAQSPEFKAELKKNILNSSESEEAKAQASCLYSRGVFDKMIPIITQNINIQNLQPHMAAQWATRYELADLKNFYQTLQSPTTKKFLALTRQGAIRKESMGEDIKRLHKQGVVSEEEIKFLVVTSMDSRYNAFIDQIKPALKMATDYQLHKNQDEALKKLAEEVAMDALDCSGTKGVGI